MNDADGALSQSAYNRLNLHPFATFTDAIALSKNPAEMEIGKSYINCTEDTSLPHSMNWHPRLSEKLGLFRLIQIPGRSRGQLHRAGPPRPGNHGRRAGLSLGQMPTTALPPFGLIVWPVIRAASSEARKATA